MPVIDALDPQVFHTLLSERRYEGQNEFSGLSPLLLSERKMLGLVFQLAFRTWGQNKSSAKSYAKGERSMNCAVVRKPRHPIPVDCHRIGPDLISSSARLDNSPGRLVVRGVGRWVNGSFSRLKID